MSRAVCWLGAGIGIFVLAACVGAPASSSAPPSAVATAPSGASAAPAPAASVAVCPTAFAPPTPTPYPTPPASIDPKAPATVWGTQPNGTVWNEGTWTKTATGQQLRGNMETLELSLSDARVSGKATFHYAVDLYETTPGMDVKTITGDMRIDAPGGTWEGQCRGTMWVYKEWITSCWLSGKGAYAGMTFVYNLVHMEPGDLLVRGQIYPGPVPS